MESQAVMNRWKMGLGALAIALASVTLVAFATPVRASADSWVHAGGQLDPDGKVSLDCSVILSPACFGFAGTSTPVRNLSISVNAKVGAILLQNRHDVRPLAADSADAIEVQIQDLSLHYVPYYASKALGAAAELGPAEYSGTYVLTIAPVKGKTWSQVSAESDVSLAAVVRSN
jgi:hypothetical protein